MSLWQPSVAVSNEDDCLKQLETIKEDFVKSVSLSDTSLNTVRGNEGTQ